MPFKRRGRKRFGRRKKRGGKKKFYPRDGASGRQGVMVNRTASKLHTAVAPHYMTKLEFAFTGHQALAANTNGYCDFGMNALLTPGDVVNLWTAATMGGTVFPAAHALNALNATGFSQLAVLYTKYRVLASKIRVTMTPDANDCLLVIEPCTESADHIGTDTQRAISQPYSKAIMCSPNNNVKQNTIQLYMSCPTVAGLTRQQYYDSDRNASVVSAVPGDVLTWNVYTASYTAAIAQANNWDVLITYWVEFYEPLPPTNV